MKLVCMGDSLTEGYGIDQSARWSEGLKRIFEDAEILNCGISGDTTAGMLARFYPDVIRQDPTHVIIMGGTNDLWFSLSNQQILSNIMAMTRHARHHGIQSIIGIPTPFMVDQGSGSKVDKAMAERIKDYQRELEAFALEDGWPVIRFYEGMTEDLFLPDGLHPTALGHDVMSKNASAVLKKL